jgi:predicted transcriptional regulator YheO
MIAISEDCLRDFNFKAFAIFNGQDSDRHISQSLSKISDRLFSNYEYSDRNSNYC